MTDYPRIGGTMAANILGVGFKTPFEAWCELTGKVEREDISDVERVEAGTFMEPAAAAWFAKRTGLKVLDAPGLVVDQQFPWLAGQPDRVIIAEGGKPGVLECKNTHGFSLKDWKTNEDGTLAAAPLGYQVQLQAYLRITGYEIGYFAAIVGGNHLETPRVNRDDAFIAAMLEELERFLAEHVQKDIPPPVSERDLGILKRLWPKDTGRVLEVPDDAPVASALRCVASLKRKIAALEKECDAAEATVKAAMQDATEIVCPSARATWKEQTSQYAAREAKTITSRVFRAKELQ